MSETNTGGPTFRMPYDNAKDWTNEPRLNDALAVISEFLTDIARDRAGPPIVECSANWIDAGTMEHPHQWIANFSVSVTGSPITIQFGGTS